MLSPVQLICLLRPHYANDGLDMPLTFHQLCQWVPGIPRGELAAALVELPGVTIADSACGSIIIPKQYFES